MITRGWLCLTLSLVVATPLSAQIILEMESRDHSLSPPRSETSFVVSDGRQLAMGLAGPGAGPDSGLIYRSSRREILMLDHRNQSYLVLDQQGMQRFTAQLNQSMGQFSQRPTTPSPLEVRRTSDAARCFGFPATRYEIWRDGRKLREMWVTDWRNIDGGREVAAVFADLGGSLTQLVSAMPSGDSKLADESVFAVMHEVDGFPVGVREYRTDGTIAREWALRSAKRERIDPAMFSPPTAYRRQPLPGS